MAGLEESDDRGTDADLALTEDVAGGGGEDPGGAGSPDEFAGFGWREEKGWTHVAEAELAACGFGGVGLPDDGLDDAGDEHPVRADLWGMTGWTLRMFCVRLYGPMAKLVLFWKGTLMTLATGFCVALARASVSLAGAAFARRVRWREEKARDEKLGGVLGS